MSTQVAKNSAGVYILDRSVTRSIAPRPIVTRKTVQEGQRGTVPSVKVMFLSHSAPSVSLHQGDSGMVKYQFADNGLHQRKNIRNPVRDDKAQNTMVA